MAEIRCVLEGEDAKKFEAVKKYHGLKADTEIIRLLITDAYREIMKA